MAAKQYLPNVYSALRKIKAWNDKGQLCPIYQPERSKLMMLLVDDGLVRFMGWERLGPLAVQTGEKLFRVSDKGLELLEQHQSECELDTTAGTV